MLSKGESLLREICAFSILNKNVIYNYRGLGIVNDKTGQPLEMDIYYPDYKLAIEFQGEEHYKETSFADTSTVNEIIRRDKLKEQYCRNHDIHYIGVKALKLNSGFGWYVKHKVVDIDAVRPNPRDPEYASKARLIEWKCVQYRKELNTKYEGHTSSKTDAKIWRDEMRKKGIEIPNDLKRATNISELDKRAVETGTYVARTMQYSRTF